MYNISNTDNNQQNVALTVLTKPSDSKNSPVLVNTYQKPGQPATIFVEIFQDYSPVINAEVTAIIETEKGSSSIYKLLDSGSGKKKYRHLINSFIAGPALYVACIVSVYCTFKYYEHLGNISYQFKELHSILFV